MEDGFTLLQLAKHLKIQPKRLLSWEYAFYFEPSLRRKGKRVVRYFPPALADVIARAAALVALGYGPRLAFYMVAKGEAPPAKSAGLPAVAVAPQ